MAFVIFEGAKEDLNEITSGLKSGLKSWLSFGTTMTGQKNKDKPKSESDSDEVEVGEKIRVGLGSA